MTAPSSIDPAHFLSEQLAQASPDLLRQMLTTFINTLMAQTSLEGNVSMNLVMMGLDNRPAQKNLKTILQEWLDFRVVTVTRRLKFRLYRFLTKQMML